MDLEQWDLQLESPQTDKLALFDQMLKKHQDTSKDDVTLLWRLTRAALVLSDVEQKHARTKECKAWIDRAVEFGQKAVAAEPESVSAQKWLCASYGRIAPFVSTKERITFGHKFKEHADIALSLDPEDRLLHHMYGRWCHEVALLTWIEKKIAKTFFGAPPESTQEEALEHLLKANQKREEWIGNRLWIGKVLLAQKKVKEALEWFELGLSLEPKTEEDEINRKELLELKKKYQK